MFHAIVCATINDFVCIDLFVIREVTPLTMSVIDRAGRVESIAMRGSTRPKRGSRSQLLIIVIARRYPNHSDYRTLTMLRTINFSILIKCIHV